MPRKPSLAVTPGGKTPDCRPVTAPNAPPLNAMSTSKLPVAIAVVAGLLLIGFGLYEYSLARTTEVQVAFALRELNAQAKHLEDLNSQAAASEQVRATLRKSAATPRADPPPGKRPAGSAHATRQRRPGTSDQEELIATRRARRQRPGR